MKGSNSLSTDKDFKIDARNDFLLRGPLSLQMTHSLTFNNAKTIGSSRDSTLRDHLVNQSIRMTRTKVKDLAADMDVVVSKQLTWGDLFFVGGNIGYSSSKPNESFSLYKTIYVEQQANDLRNYYGDYHRKGYKLGTFLAYQMSLPHRWSFMPRLVYAQSYNERHHSNYRLDLLDGDQGETFGYLPSNNVELMEALDADNSYNSNNMERDYTAQLQVTKKYRNSYLTFDLPLIISRERMPYMRSALDTVAWRSDVLFNPGIKFGTYGKNSKKVAYSMVMRKPEFEQLMPYANSTNPLSIRYNNPKLKNSIEHKLSTYLSDQAKGSDLSYWLSAIVNITQRAWGTRSTYESSTGAFTYQSDNVNGNWNVEAQTMFTRTIDKKHRVRLDVEGGVRYDHSVDFDIAYDTDVSLLSRVNTWEPELKGRLRFQWQPLVVSITTKASAYFSNGDRSNFENIHAVDYQYGGNLQYTFPVVNLTMAMDINMFSRRGYNSDMMNTDDLVWNALLSLPLCKGNVVAKLQAFDILHQLSEKTYTVNAQGRTETWYNTIPRYLMLSMAFKFWQSNGKR